MYEFIKDNQLNIMLILCGGCGVMAILLCMTQFLGKRRKHILIAMEVVAVLLLWFDRLAYIYAGRTSPKGYYMVRISNFLVFLLTSAIVFFFNQYLKDLLANEESIKKVPRRLKVVEALSAGGMMLSVVAAFTGLYYYFDESNVYHRGQGFLIAYIIPVIGPILQYTVIRQYKKSFSKLIYISLVLYIYVPLFCGILQIFIYGLSIVNMAMVAVSISLYFFTYMDINNTVKHAHSIELSNVETEKKRMQRLFDQTAKAFVSAVEKKDDFTKGTAVRVANYARKIAQLCGKDEEYCQEAYYTALLHDVGMIGIPDSVIKNEGDPGKWDYEAIRQKPVIGKEILSNITEYPYLSLGAGSSHERYNGTGYPEGLKGEEIPELARIVAVADAYVIMTTKKRYREARPDFVAREAFVKGAGIEFDPEFAGAMVRIIDEESKQKSYDDVSVVEKELTCGKYRDKVSVGIPVTGNISYIRFKCETDKNIPDAFKAPSIILFDSYDRLIHANKSAIEAYSYLEFGEIWFDNHSITTAARKIVENGLGNGTDPESKGDGDYEICAGKYEDHIKLVMKAPNYEKEVIIALQDGSTSAYIALTGENCRLYDIEIEQTQDFLLMEDVPRISEEISYIDHLESDIKNVQINMTRSAYTDGVELGGRLKLIFHSTTLPIASFVWHCPYIVIYSSDNGTVNGPNYHEYALIKINGENESPDEYATNSFNMKRKDDFQGWEHWKETNKAGIECEVSFEKKGNRIRTITENLGIYIDNMTEIREDVSKVYVALTGDRCALTDIRIR